MTPRLVAGLAGITLVTAIAAAVAVARLPGVAAVAVVNEPAFPALRAAPDAAARIEIATADGRFRLARGADGGWTAPTRFDYAVDPAEVRDLVVALADMRVVERKTRRADRHPRLEVEDVGADARSRLVRMSDANDAPLAEALFGKTRFRLTGGARQGTYLRRPGEDQAWLASGGPRIKGDVVDWLARAVVDVPRDAVRRVAITPAEGPSYAVARGSADADLTLVDPARSEAADAAAIRNLAAVLAVVTLDDVRPASGFAWPEATADARVETFDGAVYETRLAETDDGAWLALTATGDDVVATRTAGWVYRVPDHVAERLRRPLADVLAGP